MNYVLLDYHYKIELIIKEQINKLINKHIVKENTQRNNIDNIINNVINENINNLILEKKSKSENANNKILKNKKKSVLQWLQQPEVNAAEIRRKLEGEPESQEEEDGKRSYFMKKVNQQYGKDFTTSEINDLYTIKSELS
jgi:hypothetical protein